jgi:hypothetical protein
MKAILAALAAAAATLCGGAAHAGWYVNGDVERFRWAESTNPGVTETGPMFGIGGGYRQLRPEGWQFGWRARFYFGSVDYNGALLSTNQPATGTSQYTGLVNEAQAIYRLPGNANGMEVVSALVLDYWNRQLSADQREEYWVASLKLGLNFDRREAKGWFGGGGVKYPFWTRQDAHLTDIGFSANPHLEPQGTLSLYADVGYRFTRRWSLAGYYDSYRFDESDATQRLINPAIQGCSGVAPDPAGGCRLFQPQSRQDSFGLRLQYSFE